MLAASKSPTLVGATLLRNQHTLDPFDQLISAVSLESILDTIPRGHVGEEKLKQTQFQAGEPDPSALSWSSSLDLSNFA